MRIRRSPISRTGTWKLLSLVSIFSLVLWGNSTGCQPEDWMLEVNCYDCYGSSPDSANLIVYITINQQNDSVPLVFYRGSYEDGEVDWVDTATSEEFYLYSEIDMEYTVVATYRSGQQTVLAFDKDKMHIYDADEECGSPCYIVKGGIFDLRLIE